MSKAKVYDVAVPVLIVVNAAVFVAAKYAPGLAPFFEENFVVTYTAVHDDHRFWTIFTSMFYHQSLIHLAITTAALISYGIMLDHKIGSKWFLEFYVVSGMVAAMNHVMISKVIYRPDDVMYGGLAPMAGVVFLLALIFRNRPVRIFRFLTIEPGWIAMLFIVPDMMGIFSHDAGRDYPIGHAGHVAAALLALVYYHKSLRKRVWRNLMAVGDAADIRPVVVKRMGWVVPCKDEQMRIEMTHFFQKMLGMNITDEGKPIGDRHIKEMTKFDSPFGSLTLVETEPMIPNNPYRKPVLSITVDNLNNACKNLESNQIQSVTPLYHLNSDWAIVHYQCADGEVYEIKGPYETT